MIRNQIQKGGFSWYLVLTKRGAERLAKENIERRLGDRVEVYLPMHAPEPARPKPGKPTEITPRPFLPGYLFVAFDVTDPEWGKIFSTFGVRSMYCTGAAGERRPRALPPRWIEQLQSREVAGLVCLAPPLESKFKAGAAVQYRGIHSTPIDAVFLEPVDAKRVAILVSLLGSDSRQVVDATLVKDRNT